MRSNGSSRSGGAPLARYPRCVQPSYSSLPRMSSQSPRSSTIATQCPASCCETCPLETCGSASIGATGAVTTAPATVDTDSGSDRTLTSIAMRSIGETWHAVAPTRHAYGAFDRLFEHGCGQRFDRHHLGPERLRRYGRPECEDNVAVHARAGGSHAAEERGAGRTGELRELDPA